MDLYRLLLNKDSAKTQKGFRKALKGAIDSAREESARIAVNKQLLDYFLQINLQDNSKDSWQKWYNICQKDYFQIKILIGQNAWSSTISIAEENLKIAKKFEFTDIIVETYRIMMLYHGSIALLARKYFSYLEGYNLWDRILAAERNVERRYSELMIFEDQYRGDSRKIHEEALRVFDSIKPDLEQYSTFLLHLYGRLIENLIYTSKRDYSKSVAVCQDAIHFFLGKGFSAKMPISTFLCNQMVSYLQMRNFTAGKQAAEAGVKYMEKGSPHWFRYQELLVLLSLHTQEYQQAYTYYHTAVNHRKLSMLIPVARETWRLIEAYMYFLADQKKIIPHNEDKYLTQFRPSKFLNEIPALSKDKRGMNVPVLVFQILTLISKNRYDDAIARIEAVEKYRTRYLRNHNAYRSNYFIKMLLVIPVQGFNKSAVIRHTHKYSSKLRASSCDFTNTSHEIEIIPYEDLWEMVLDTLPQKQGKNS